MALQAKSDFAEIHFDKALMVGDSMSDMEFGKKTGMTTVFIHSEKVIDAKIDYCFESLKELSEFIQQGVS